MDLFEEWDESALETLPGKNRGLRFLEAVGNLQEKEKNYYSQIVDRSGLSINTIKEHSEGLEEIGVVNIHTKGKQNNTFVELTEKGERWFEPVQNLSSGNRKEKINDIIRHDVSNWLKHRGIRGKDNMRKEFIGRISVELNPKLVERENIEELKRKVNMLWDEIWEKEKSNAKKHSFQGVLKENIDAPVKNT
jgi:predicted transcriptional regulator